MSMRGNIHVNSTISKLLLGTRGFCFIVNNEDDISLCLSVYLSHSPSISPSVFPELTNYLNISATADRVVFSQKLRPIESTGRRRCHKQSSSKVLTTWNQFCSVQLTALICWSVDITSTSALSFDSLVSIFMSMLKCVQVVGITWSSPCVTLCPHLQIFCPPWRILRRGLL